MTVVCELIELDFEKGTATFKIPENSEWTAGFYLIAKSEYLEGALS